jgi:hypothetical protein
MKTIYLSVLFVATLFTAAAAQPNAVNLPRTVTDVFDRNVSANEARILSVAEAMPEEKYDFAPVNGEFKGVRTFSQMIKHVAVDQYLDAAALLREKVPIDQGANLNGPDSLRRKAEILKFLRDAFNYMHKGIRTVNQKNMMESEQFENDRMPRLVIANAAIVHPMDHYGQLVEYLRMNGIDPQLLGK